MYTLMADIMVRDNRRDQAIHFLKEGVDKIESKDAKAQLVWHLANFYLDADPRRIPRPSPKASPA